MEGERLGRVVAVTPLSQLNPVACAAFWVAVPEASGLPPPPAAQPPPCSRWRRGGPPRGASTDEPTVRRTGLWAAPASHQTRHAYAGSRVENRTGTGDLDTRGDARRVALPPHAVTRPEQHMKRGNQRWVDTRTRSTTGNAWS